MRNIGLRTIALLVAIGGAAAAQSQSVESFYKGKVVRVIVSQDAGSEYDIWARLLLRHMGRHMPANPTFIVQNMPGGGGIAGTNYLYGAAEKDGSVIGMVGRNMPNLALIKEPNVRFDPTKFNWIGSPELTNRVCVSYQGSRIKRGEDLFENELIVGGSGSGTAISTTPVLLANLLGMKFRLVEGYNNAPGIMLAMERGEVAGICQTITAIRNSRPGWIESGRLKVLFNLERSPIPGLDAPTVYKFVKTDEQRATIGLYNSNLELGRPMLAPPGVPADRVAALRSAFNATLDDPELKAEAAMEKMELSLVKGEDIEAFIADLMKTPDELVKRMDSLSKQK
jgi:tripartite-type tricarboxylate transporter receptor subunit TctC